MSTLNINQIYKLDKIFTEEYFYSSLTKPPILKLSNIQEFLSHYKEEIHKQGISGEHLNFKTNQIYTSEFFFDDNQYYKISWNIDKAEQIIAESNAPVVKLELKKLSQSIFEKDITSSHLNFAKHNKKPIIVAFYEPTKQYIPIDGNHRSYACLKENKKTIDTYILSPQGHMLAMCSTIDYALYMFAHNLNVLGNYACGEINYNKFMDEMYRF
ncbi:hypothetical protein JW813_06880 [Clostridium botulinum]|uniref:ParB/Srx family N-terminal domain-containing protein n=1 Tax=Clostridium botulinum TaxID=1491 RepID=UPI0022476317|nr:ParB/Srx family N-terminal domain-containing protein [Clostridium botulinum]UZP04728.1 hypothetical protein JW813_06880 [Clostridium botulinum]UZP08140.1 hypothetical protein JYA71_07155 [Clostridium botulinum]UZP11467.1 hypothetical protein JYA74_06875 [Clostridium botulinum]